MTDPLADYRQAIDVELERLLSTDARHLAPLYGMMRYHLGWCDANFEPHTARAGKRLRPIMSLLCCEALGGDWRRALPFAAAIELVHNFSLIHDDIEDDSSTRHERTTLWRVWGLAQGINTGDAMWAVSHAAMLDLSVQGYEAETVLAAIALLDRACLQLCAGQFLDISFEGQLAVSQTAYQEMARGKTATLLAAACEGGALLAGAEASQQAALAALGLELGLAYQIIDDLLGLWGDAVVTGKSAASDLATRKMTFPIVYALEWERERGENALHQAFATPSSPASDAQVLQLLARAGAQEHARSLAQAHHAALLLHLEAAHLQGAAGALFGELVLGLVDRTY